MTDIDANDWYCLVSIDNDHVQVAAIVRCYAVACSRCGEVEPFDTKLAAESAAYQHAMDCRPSAIDRDGGA